jgi:hypothetical protein
MFGYFKAVRDMSSLVTAIQAENVQLLEEIARERTARYYMQTRMAELKTEQAGVVADLKSRLAIAQANFEWLSAMHNVAAAERSQLMLQRVGVQVPAPTVAMRRDAENAPAGQGQPLADDPPNLAELSVRDDLFEDMGNLRAGMEGVKSQVYDDPSFLLGES